MVPTARLELARPRSLPPQDSVSTNSTTSAKALAHLVSQDAMRPAFNYDLLRDITRFGSCILGRHRYSRLRRSRGRHFRPLYHTGRLVLLQSKIG
jgi:hypothetical protein